MPSVGRNDPCPCGSGRKYKKCCGAVIELKTVTRQCGTCTACCDGWVTGVIEGYEMKPGTPCHFRGDGCCTIYERRPQDPCRKFVCGWLQPNSPFPEEFRPDRIGVMILPIKWRGSDAYVLRSAGKDPDEAMLTWMRAFCERTQRPFFYEIGGERYGFGPPEFQIEMSERIARGDRLW